MPKKKVPYSQISFVIDRSGSMGGLVQDTIGGFNTFIDKQKEAPGKATVSRYQFDHEFQTDYSFVDINEVKPLTALDYVPRGSTALNDAIGLAVSDTQKQLDQLKASRRRRPDKVYLVVITDGGENASKEFRDVSKLKSLLELKQAEKDVIWELVFLGANLDVQSVARSFAIPLSNVVGYTSNQKGTEAVYGAVASAMTRSRTMDYNAGGTVVQSFGFDASEIDLAENTK